MNNEVNCNGAGEMPGREGVDSYDDHFANWIEENIEHILEAYRDSINTIYDVPNDFITKMYAYTMEHDEK